MTEPILSQRRQVWPVVLIPFSEPRMHAGGPAGARNRIILNVEAPES